MFDKFPSPGGKCSDVVGECDVAVVVGLVVNGMKLIVDVCFGKL